ncbi:MAG: 4-phosphopantetheinyl transferase, partial [Bacteroidota bacterium]
MIHVLYTYLNETQHEALLKKYTDDCTIDFRQRLLKFRRWQDQQASLLGRVLLKKGIKELYGKQCPTIT